MRAGDFTANNKPTAPSNLQASQIVPGSVSLTWIDNSVNESSFQLQRSTSNKFNQNIVNIPIAANTNFYNDVAIQPNTIYYYRIRAINGLGTSAWSNTATIQTLP
jgi:predicted phage tail protein